MSKINEKSSDGINLLNFDELAIALKKIGIERADENREYETYFGIYGKLPVVTNGENGKIKVITQLIMKWDSIVVIEKINNSNIYKED